MPRKFKVGDLVTKTHKFVHYPYNTKYGYTSQQTKLLQVISYFNGRYQLKNIRTDENERFFQERFVWVRPDNIEKFEQDSDLEEWM